MKKRLAKQLTVGCVSLVIPNLPNSEAVDFSETETNLKSDTKFFIFRFIAMKTRFPVEKHDYESGARQLRVKLLINIATRANSSRFQIFADEKTGISPKSAKPSACWSRRLSRPSKPAKPAVFGIW